MTETPFTEKVTRLVNARQQARDEALARDAAARAELTEWSERARSYLASHRSTLREAARLLTRAKVPAKDIVAYGRPWDKRTGMRGWVIEEIVLTTDGRIFHASGEKTWRGAIRLTRTTQLGESRILPWASGMFWGAREDGTIVLRSRWAEPTVEPLPLDDYLADRVARMTS